MNEIRVNTDIQFDAGFLEYTIDTDRDLDLSFRFVSGSHVFIRILKAKKLRIRGFVGKNQDVNVLFWNEAKAPIEMDESFEVLEEATLHLSHAECNEANTKLDCYVALREKSANAYVNSASLVASSKHYNINVVNFAPHTHGEMKNYAVVLKEGKLMIDAVGKIVKGAKRAHSHQTSRALCFEAGQNSTILPELLIDENDVQASHAMTIGRMDEEQLYYMKSRGLDDKQCMSLISHGYLLPIVNDIENEELKNTLIEELERKLNSL